MDEVMERLMELLGALGYEEQDGDDVILEFCVGEVVSIIKNNINWQNVPEGLMHTAVNMALGRFLQTKKTFSPDSLSWFDLGLAVKQLAEGDKSTTFATGDSSLTDEQRLDSYINWLLTNGFDEFGSFRRVRWG